MYVCVTCVCLVSRDARKGIGYYPGSLGGCEPTRGCWEVNSGPEQQAQASEPSLQPKTRHFCLNLEMIVKAVVPLDQRDSHRTKPFLVA